MKNYTWTVTDLYTMDTETETDYVVRVIYDIIGTETIGDQTYTVSQKEISKFEVLENENFTPYADLTNAIIIGWIKDNLGTDTVNAIETSIGNRIDKEINPPVEPAKKQLPW